MYNEAKIKHIKHLIELYYSCFINYNHEWITWRSFMFKGDCILYIYLIFNILPIVLKCFIKTPTKTHLTQLFLSTYIFCALYSIQYLYLDLHIFVSINFVVICLTRIFSRGFFFFSSIFLLCATGLLLKFSVF